MAILGHGVTLPAAFIGRASRTSALGPAGFESPYHNGTGIVETMSERSTRSASIRTVRRLSPNGGSSSPLDQLLESQLGVQPGIGATEETIARSKLVRPQLPPNLVDRPRLLNELDRGYDRPMRLVSAAPGYGKTTLVSHWLESRSYPRVWVSLDDHDDGLASLVVPIVAGIRASFPSAMGRSLGVLSRGSIPGPAALSLALLTDLSEIDQRFVLVLDGTESLGDRPVLELLSAVLRYPPDSLHLVLIGRRNPVLPIASLSAAIRVSEIGADALRFTPGETLDLMRKSGYATVRWEVARAWTEATNGWIGGLGLAIAGSGVPLSRPELRSLSRHARERVLSDPKERKLDSLRRRSTARPATNRTAYGCATS